MTTADEGYGSRRRSSWGFDAFLDVQPWKQDAICSQTDPEAFFPEKGGSTSDAKRLCQRCPVRRECLQEALDNDERFGIWGGLSERERRRLKHGETVTPTMSGGHRYGSVLVAATVRQCRICHRVVGPDVSGDHVEWHRNSTLTDTCPGTGASFELTEEIAC